MQRARILQPLQMSADVLFHDVGQALHGRTAEYLQIPSIPLSRGVQIIVDATEHVFDRRRAVDDPAVHPHDHRPRVRRPWRCNPRMEAALEMTCRLNVRQ